MRKLFFLLALLLSATYSFSQEYEYPVEYYRQLDAAWEKYHISLADTAKNDFAVHPIETVPIILPFNVEPANHGKDFYKIPYTKPARKGVSFIIDTEGEFYHKDLQQARWKELERTFTGETVKGNVNGHGIHCAGIIASREAGILWEYVLKNEYKVVALKSLRNNGTGSFNEVAAACEYVLGLAPGLQKQGWVVGVSMSLGGSGNSPMMNEIIKRMRAAGIIVTAAAGNTGTQPIGTPANAPDCIAVGSVNKSLQRSSFSSYGTGLYIMAHGQEIRSTYLNDTYAVLNGTSMACPNAHGWYMWRAMTVSADLNVVYDPTQVQDLGEPGYDLLHGNGISVAKPGGEPTPPNPPNPPNPPTPPNPPVKDTVIVLDIPLDEKYQLIYGNSIGQGTTYYVTDIQFELKVKGGNIDEPLKKLIESTRDFYRNRGLVVRPGDDFDEVLAITWFFHEMFLRNNYKVEGAKIKSLTGQTAEGYPLRVHKPYVNSLSEFREGVIIYRNE